MDLLSVLASIIIYAGISVFLFELFQSYVLKKLLNIELTVEWTQALTWFFSFLVVYISGLFSFGIFGGVTIVYTILIGALVGLSANGIWSFPPVQDLLSKFKIKL